MLIFLALLCLLWTAYWCFAYLRDEDKYNPAYVSPHRCMDCAEGNHNRNNHESSSSSHTANNNKTSVPNNNAAFAEIPTSSPSVQANASQARPEPTKSGVKPLFTAPTSEPDDLKQIKGVGDVMEGTLNDLGITTFKQLSEFQTAEIQMVTDALSELNAGFGDRITRDEWVEQAKVLAGR